MEESAPLFEQCGDWCRWPYREREWKRRKRYRLGVEAMPKEIRSAFLEISEEAQSRRDYTVLDALHKLGAAAGRSEQKRRSNRKTERDRRATIGARLPLATVARYKACAEREGVTMYRWAVRAFEAYAKSGG